jgi:Uri superfamily endonuclease
MVAFETIRFCRSAAEAPSLPGAYVLQIELARATRVKIGCHLPITLAVGRHLYCGSAKGPGDLQARPAHHFCRFKTRRWHVDQLNTRGRLVDSWIVPDGDECELVRLLQHLPVPIAGFGNSDCATCQSHLLSWPGGAALPSPVFDTPCCSA